ncbi:hypothetical protein [Pseudomonas juntendi]|uniref:hypothetical protein n=1 Tax=Pseudomonas juntendi TaxID=2666183 RepID=UPI002FBEBC28
MSTNQAAQDTAIALVKAAPAIGGGAPPGPRGRGGGGGGRKNPSVIRNLATGEVVRPG